jgi:hypothetical protein
LLAKDTMTVSGQVDPEGAYNLPAQDYVIIEILLPQDSGNYQTIYSAKVPVGPDKSYSHTISANKLFNATSFYGVAITYGSVHAYGTVKFIAGPYRLAFEGKTYDINYKIFNGSLQRVNINNDRKSLILDTAILSENMTIEIPRKILDSTDGNGNPADFKVFLDGKEATFQELGTSPSSRILEVAIPYDNDNPLGKHEIEVMGTHVIPEFSIVAIVMIAAVGLAQFMLRHFSQL